LQKIKRRQRRRCHINSEAKIRTAIELALQHFGDSLNIDIFLYIEYSMVFSNDKAIFLSLMLRRNAGKTGAICPLYSR
jgi:hypothetical protein